MESSSINSVEPPSRGSGNGGSRYFNDVEIEDMVINPNGHPVAQFVCSGGYQAEILYRAFQRHASLYRITEDIWNLYQKGSLQLEYQTESLRGGFQQLLDYMIDNFHMSFQNFRRLFGTQPHDLNIPELLRFQCADGHTFFLAHLICKNFKMRNGRVKVAISQYGLKFINRYENNGKPIEHTVLLNRFECYSQSNEELYGSKDLCRWYDPICNVIQSFSTNGSVELQMDTVCGYGGESQVILHKNMVLKVCPIYEKLGDMLEVALPMSGNFKLNLTGLQFVRNHPEYHTTMVNHDNVISYNSMIVQKVHGYDALVIEMPKYDVSLSEYLAKGKLKRLQSRPINRYKKMSKKP